MGLLTDAIRTKYSDPERYSTTRGQVAPPQPRRSSLPALPAFNPIRPNNDWQQTLKVDLEKKNLKNAMSAIGKMEKGSWTHENLMRTIMNEGVPHNVSTAMAGRFMGEQDKRKAAQDKTEQSKNIRTAFTDGGAALKADNSLSFGGIYDIVSKNVTDFKIATDVTNKIMSERDKAENKDSIKARAEKKVKNGAKVEELSVFERAALGIKDVKDTSKFHYVTSDAGDSSVFEDGKLISGTGKGKSKAPSKEDKFKVVGGRLVDISGDKPKIVIDSIDKETKESLFDKGLVKVGDDLIDVSDPKNPKAVYQSEDKNDKSMTPKEAGNKIDAIEKHIHKINSGESIMEMAMKIPGFNTLLDSKGIDPSDVTAKERIMDYYKVRLDDLYAITGKSRKVKTVIPTGGGATHTFVPGQGIVPN